MEGEVNHIKVMVGKVEMVERDIIMVVVVEVEAKDPEVSETTSCQSDLTLRTPV